MKKTTILILTLIILSWSKFDATGVMPIPEVPRTRIPGDIAAGARTQPLISDHTTDDINAIPQAWIEAAKADIHIAYGHTSHGSQISSGMSGLVAFANGGGRGLSLPVNIFQYDPDSNNGGTHLHYFEGSGYDGNGDLAYDVGYSGWDTRTYDYLGTVDPVTGRGSNHPEINVLMWSWCGQVSSMTEETLVSHYLQPMNQLELDYPGVTFVYMTGHADGSGESGNLHLRNQQIRQFVIDNHKVLFDFYDFDIYDPDDVYYGDKAVTDGLDYDSDNDGVRDANWGQDWQADHTLDTDWYSVSCAHSESINCNQKAYAAWWLWARLAGWDPQGIQVYMPMLER